MINTRLELQYYIEQDAKSSMRKSINPHLFGDEIWKFQLNLRKLEYSINNHKVVSTFYRKIIHHYRSLQLGIEIHPNNFGEGLWIGHSNGIVVNPLARIGKNCTIMQNATIGNAGGGYESCAYDWR